MAWRPLKDIVHAVCTHHFEATEQDDLGLDIGDDVYITEIGGPGQDWCRGWLLAQPSIVTGLTVDPGQPLKPRAYSGIFPRNHVEVREVLGEGARSTPDYARGGGSRGSDTVAGGEETTDSVLDKSQDQDAALARARSTRHTRLYRAKVSASQLVPLDLPPMMPGRPKEKAPLPALRIGDATEFSVQEPLVDEISSCIREWHSTKLHDLLLKHEYDLVEKISNLVVRLDNSRKQLVHDLLTEKELSDLRERIVWDLVDGNKMLEEGIIVRSPRDKGRTLTARDNIPEMLKLQATMNLRDRPPAPLLQQSSLSHILVEIKDFPDMYGEAGLLHMYLCSKSGDGRPHAVSEVFAVEVPLEESSATTSPPAAQQARTLFVDLTKAEVGSTTDPTSHIYLICMLHREEPFRAEPQRGRGGALTPTPSAPFADRSEDSVYGQSANGAAGGRRRSMFSRQGSRKDLLARSSSKDRASRPTTATSTTSSRLQKERPYTPGSSEAAARPMTAEKKVRRVVGYSALDVGALIHQHDHAEISMALWTPAQPYDDIDDPQTGKDGWDDVLRLLARSPTGQFTRVHSLGSFSVALQGFAGPDADEVVKKHPGLLHDIHCTQALDFVAPHQLRSDIYLTLREPRLPHNARCFHPQEGSVPLAADSELRNLQLTMEVRTDTGKRVENAIWPTSNRSPHTAFRTPAIDRGESWNQTLRLSIPTEDLPHSHVVVSIADGSHFPFALAWLQLWDAETGYCSQGPQTLALWDYSEYTASTVRGRGAYQSLPSHFDQIQAPDKSAMASLMAHVTVTSSSTTQDANLAALMEWNGSAIDGLMETMDGFKRAPDAEIIKFFQPLLAALDRIFDAFYGLTDDSGAHIGDTYAERALSCLIYALHLTHDRRFSDTRDVLEEYNSNRQSLQNASKSAARAFRTFLGRPYEAGEARELRSALKVSGQLMKFITGNHAGAPAAHALSTHNPLLSVQNAALALMRNPRETLYGTQVILMQNFASWLPELVSAMVPEAIYEFAEDMLNASATKKGSLRMHRLVLLKEVSGLDMFAAPELRLKLLLSTRDWLGSYWITPDNVGDPTQVEGLRLSCSIIASQQPYMGSESVHYIVKLFEAYNLLITHTQAGHSQKSRTAGLARKPTYSMPFPTAYPFQSISVQEQSPPNETLIEIASLLTAFFQQNVPAGEFYGSASTSHGASTKELFITTVLHVLRSIQKGQAFPPSWVTLYVTHAKYAVVMLQWLLDILVDNFLPSDAADLADIMSFDNELWEAWFETLISLSLNKMISMENFNDQTSRAIWTIGGDIRAEAAGLLRHAWNALGWKTPYEYKKAMAPMERMGGFQVGLTAKLVPSAVRLCMCVHAGLRGVGLDILRSMIVSEWELNGNLDVVQGAFFDALDTIYHEEGPIKSNFTSVFLDELKRYFTVLQNTTESVLYDAVVDMVEQIERLLAVLNDLSSVRDPGSQLIRMAQFLEFLRLIGRSDAYVRRVHDLALMQTKMRNYSSAALAISMHVAALESDASDPKGSRMVPAANLGGLEMPEEAARSRKMRLYRLIANHFERGYAWDKVLDTWAQLAKEHQAAWNMADLAEVRIEEARVSRLLVTAPVTAPRYFLVSFDVDEDFPVLVRGKRFVFEGPADYDRKGFATALHSQYPFVVNLSPEYAHPTPHTEGPAVRITAVTPFKDYLHPINQQSAVKPQYREHVLTSSPRTFAITNRHDNPNVSVADQIVEKTIYTTADHFPTLLAYSAIVSEKRVTLSPVQAAIDRTHRKTQMLGTSLHLASTKTSDQNTEALVQAIRSSVDPAASSSVSEYHKLLSHVPPSTADTALSSEAPSFMDGADIVEDEESLLRTALRIALEDHARSIEGALASPLFSRDVRSRLRDWFEATFALELHMLYPVGDWRKRSVAWIDPVEEFPRIEHHEDKHEDNGHEPGLESGRTTPTPSRRRSLSRLSIRKRLSFLSIGGKSVQG